MKHSLTALLLTLALFCCLLTGCGPTPDVPGGSEGSNGSSSGSTNSGTEPDDSNSGGVSAPKLQPSIVMNRSVPITMQPVRTLRVVFSGRPTPIRHTAFPVHVSTSP